MEKRVTQGFFYFWIGYFLYLGRVADNSSHMHHAVQVIFNRKGRFQLGMGDQVIECAGVLINSDIPHQLLSSDATQVHLLIDRETTIARAIKQAHLGDDKFKILDGPLLERLIACTDLPGDSPGSCKTAHAVFGKITAVLAGCPENTTMEIDPRIQKTLRLLKSEYISQTLVTADLARVVCLSEGRLMHLFTEQIGIPVRRYVLWMRAMSAFRFALAGESLTEAAHRAGFADSAHLSRTFRSMYGITLSSILKNSRFVQVSSCIA